MAYAREHLELSDEALAAQCDVHIYKASGPGGQHRNKVSSAVRYRHRPTGISAQGQESRSQRDNRTRALARLRMKIACLHRCPLPPAPELPPRLAECIHVRRGGEQQGRRRLQIGRKDHRFCLVAAIVLDALQTNEGRLAPTAAMLSISTANLASMLKADRHVLAAAAAIRKPFGLGGVN